MSDFIHNMPMTQYRELPGVSFHALCDFGKSPLFYYRKHVMKVIPDWESDAMRLGTCVHSIVLEGQASFDATCVKCPDKFVTEGGAVSKAKDAKAWAAEQGDKIILSPADHALCLTLFQKVYANQRAKELLSDGKAEVVSKWQHHTQLACKSRADWLHNDYIVDLKTCHSLNEFEADAVKYNYHGQAAFYAEAFKRSAAYLVAVEKSEPYNVGIWRVGPTALQAGREENDRLLLLLSAAQECDRWPGDFEERVLELSDTKPLTKQASH
jgi:hypothetical protein